MKIIINDKYLDSRTYRKIFEFIQKEGDIPFKKFVEEAHEIDTDSIIESAIFYDDYPLTELIEQNKMIVEFLKQFGDFFMHDGFDSFKLKKFILDTSKKIDRLPLFIENSKILEDLRIGTIFLGIEQYKEFFRTEVFTDENGHITDIRKCYSDGKIRYSVGNIREYCGCEEYKMDISGIGTKITRTVDGLKIFTPAEPTWIIEAENHARGTQCRYACIEDFGFDSSNLPTDEELSSYEEPQTLKLFLSKK